MYVIRRVWAVKPRAVREAATIVQRIGQRHHESGRRSEVRVYFNGSTLPGERDRVYMEWTAETIETPYGKPSVDGLTELSARLRALTDDSWIEFYELMTPEKESPIQSP